MTACRRPFNRNNFLRFERIYGGLTIAELQMQGISALCNPADVAPPYSLVATGGVQINLTWIFEGGANDGFIIYRNTTGVDLLNDPLEVIAVAAQRTYTDTTAVAGILYYYLIVATNEGNLSSPSNIATATLLSFLFILDPSNN
jgi:hypothetical protein